ncbi:MAG: Sir2 family NAD-dependent protein deacetylase, partial [Polyangiales bacterium]
SLERAGVVNGLITQNVDRLHHAAGSQTVIELHGALAEVRCLACGAIEDRAALQQRLLASNPDFTTRSVEIAPDGDAELANVSGFAIPACLACDGILKPNVVFFGDSVPRARVDAAFRLLDEADVLLVVGSSLAVFSGYRFVLRAAERSMPIGLVNVGETRADTHARVRVDARAGEVLPALARALVG